MNFLHTLKKNDLVIGDLPYTDLPYVKTRPLLIVSAEEYLSECGHVIALMITSARGSSWPHDYMIEDFSTNNLRKGSVVRFKIASVPASFLRSNIGRLGKKDAQQVDSRLRALLDI